MVAAPFLFSVVQFESQARQLIQKKKNYPILLFFAIYFLLIALRGISVGYDTQVYQKIFDNMAWTNWGSLFSPERDEKLFYILNKLVHVCSLDFQVLLAIVAFLTVFPLAKLYYEESDNSMVSIALFMIIPVFEMNFSGIRQGIAVSLGVFVFYAVKKRKPIRFLVLTLVAMSFHTSAFILLLMYPLYHARFRSIHLPLLVPIGVLIYLFNENIYRLILPVLGEEYANQYEQVTETGAYTMIILFILFLAYAFIAPSKELMDETTLGMRNFLILVLFIQLFAPISTIVMRMNYYYLIFVPLLIPRITARWKSVDPFITKVVNIVMIVFFIGYFFFNMNVGTRLGIYPYTPFWEQVLPQ